MKTKKQQQPVNVGFAKTYVGCSVVANIMGLHEETVRKRVKAGKIPATRGPRREWIFSHADLAARMIQPFASGTPAIALSATLNAILPPLPTKFNETEVVFVLDRSGSMSSLMGQARKNLEEQIDVLCRASGPNDRYRITVIAFDDKVKTTLSGHDVAAGHMPSTSAMYPDTGGNTAMSDAILAAIEYTKLQVDHGQAFLVSVVTDGGENASRRIAGHDLSQQIAGLIGTGRYTFAYAGPRGSEGYARIIGIPVGNVTTWEQTQQGTRDLGRVSAQSFSTYTQTRSAGTMSSTSFYAEPVVSNPQDFANKLGQQLVKLDPADFKAARVMPTDPIVIRQFCEAKLGGFQKGKVHYQLTESEKVQDYKTIVIQDTATGSFYSGWDAAAKLLGIPKFSGTVKIRPGKLGEFKVFVQSTSVNRKLKPGTVVVCLA